MLLRSAWYMLDPTFKRWCGLSLLVQVDLLVPLSPDLGGCEHATGPALVTEGCLTCSVCTTARYSRNTGDSSTCHDIRSMPVVIVLCSSYRYPTILQMSVRQLSRLQHKVASCFSPFQCGQSCRHVSLSIPRTSLVFVLDNVRSNWGAEDGWQSVG